MLAPDPNATRSDPAVIPVAEVTAKHETFRNDTVGETRVIVPVDPAAAAPSAGGNPSVLARLAGGRQERYEVRGVIGQGGMGQVLEAHDRDLGRVVALKRASAPQPSPAQRQRLLVEAQITGQLDHPGIVSVHDLGLAPDGSIYYTMKLVRGGVTLREVLSRLQRDDADALRSFTLERRVQIVQQVAHALEYAHAKGVMHRDVKPENVMIGRHGEVFLLDWGVADLVEERDDAPRTKTHVRPPSGVHLLGKGTVGTPLYMAPEQAAGVASPASDVYSMCAVLFELITLRHHLDDPPTTPLEVIQRAQERQGQPQACERHDLGAPALRRLCGRGLDPDPARRPASAAAIEQELQAWLEGRARVSCPTTFAVRALRAWAGALEARPRLATALTYGGLAVLVLLVATLAVLALAR